MARKRVVWKDAPRAALHVQRRPVEHTYRAGGVPAIISAHIAQTQEGLE